jgi:hypothetical protein
MLGAVAGDIIGSVHEFLEEKTMDFPLFVEGSRFTDDSVLTIAVADCLLTGSSYIDKFHEYTRAYPDRCYGAGFWHWVELRSGWRYRSGATLTPWLASLMASLRRSMVVFLNTSHSSRWRGWTTAFGTRSSVSLKGMRDARRNTALHPTPSGAMISRRG